MAFILSIPSVAWRQGREKTGVHLPAFKTSTSALGQYWIQDLQRLTAARGRIRWEALLGTTVEKQAAVVVASIQLVQRNRFRRNVFYVIDKLSVKRIFNTAIDTAPLGEFAFTIVILRMFDHYQRVAHSTTQAGNTMQVSGFHRLGTR
ncbi:c9.2 [Ichnoviriform fugitivi]|uniref:C9.2 n=1 Tax=Ichnoviriform fugitivi TaxID=265522 RepID=A2Q0H5_9VIRU|nr:c9.2 [Ichnoviriform fugitivi]BAF45690.1 c9.2 [Ichnoviriform fugitivi]